MCIDLPAFLQHPYNCDKLPGGIYRYEHIWIEHQPLFAERGYRLRPRYRPDWKPSRRDTDLDPTFVEDSIFHWVRIT